MTRQTTIENERDLIKEYRETKSLSRKNQLFRKFDGLVHHELKNYTCFTFYPDLVQEARITLHTCLMQIDLSKKTRISTYSITSIRRSIKRFVMKNCLLWKVNAYDTKIMKHFYEIVDTVLNECTHKDLVELSQKLDIPVYKLEYFVNARLLHADHVAEEGKSHFFETVSGNQGNIEDDCYLKETIKIIKTFPKKERNVLLKTLYSQKLENSSDRYFFEKGVSRLKHELSLED